MVDWGKETYLIGSYFPPLTRGVNYILKFSLSLYKVLQNYKDLKMPLMLSRGLSYVFMYIFLKKRKLEPGASVG